ncbi:gephyrin-like molybdotransferase Glp [Azospirillum thermophilum]|uniref:Molybdopterin molybdenumtransferase n=1 Tax=Azospirillum thermophilum TaxID=2202148 RepID=A0A2S2CM09_9PROT|nr:gephyrin-like molybdotransferase Glp [Azospirillum thermophilum]AWK85511.1 molybdopterin molybdenumtransferase MoeA [Azospirillum thermophilum]
MVQLSNDCFAFGGEMMAVDAALALLAERVQPVTGSERVALVEAQGRILAEPVVAPFSVPPHDNSAVDGYAVFFDDLNPAGETVLPVTARVAAGHPLGRDGQRGEAVRIFTGAPMPGGFDTVFMQEDCRLEGDRVVLPAGLKRGANRRFAGEDIARGATVLQAGRRLRPEDIGLLASLGLREVAVRRPLRVAVFSTGDEVREPGSALPTGCVYDANRFALMAALSRLGCAVTDLGILADRFDVIRQSLAEAAGSHDALITSGGMSTGEEDHVKAAVEANGRLDFWRLAIKPGRPVALGRVGEAVFVGLPGNPVAVMVTFLRVARPILLRLMGAAEPDPVLFAVRAGFTAKKKAGRREYVRATLTRGEDGLLTAVKHPRDGAGILSSLVESDGFVELPEEVTKVEPGMTVAYLPFSEVR